MKTLSHWVKLVETEERAIDAFVFDRAEQNFNAAFGEFRNGAVLCQYGIAKQRVKLLQDDLQKIMVDLVKLHSGWLQRHLISMPVIRVLMASTGSEIGAETGTSSKRVTIHLPYPVLGAAFESDEIFEEVCQIFAGAVGHEFVHVVQLLRKSFSQDQFNTPGAITRRGDVCKSETYLAAPHELEAYAHTVVYDLIRVLRNVPETMRNAMMNTILNNRNIMANKSKSYERYMDNASDNTLDVLDGMVGRLLRRYFSS